MGRPKGTNGETLCHSEMLSTKQACKDAIKVIKRRASSANVYDETGEIAAVSASARLISV